MFWFPRFSQGKHTSVRFAFGDLLMMLLLVCSEVLFKWLVSRCRSGSFGSRERELMSLWNSLVSMYSPSRPGWIVRDNLSNVKAFHLLSEELLINSWCSAGLLYEVLFRYIVNFCLGT